ATRLRARSAVRRSARRRPRRGAPGVILPADALAHEQMLMRKLGGSPKGLISESAAFELGSRLIEADPDHGDNLTRIRFDIESRSWWHIVILCPGPLLEMQRRQVPPPIS